MTEPSVLDLVREALDALSPQQLFSYTSWTRHDGETDPNLIASIVTQNLNYNNDALISLISHLRNCRDTGLKLSPLSTELQESLVSWLSAASISGFSRSSVGIAISQDVNHASLVVTSPLMKNWGFLTWNSLYFPLVFFVERSQEQHRTILERVHGRPFNWMKEFHDDYNRLVKDIIHIWALIFNHWAFIKSEEKAEPSTPVIIKKEANDAMEVDIAPLAPEKTVKAESEDDIKLPIRPTRRFTGVYPPRRYKRHSLPPVFAQGPVIRSLPTPAQPSNVKSEEAIVKLDPNEEDEIRILHTIPPYQNFIPPSIRARLDQIPRLQDLPDISSFDIYHLFERKKFSEAFGGGQMSFEGRWGLENKPRKMQEMGNSGHENFVALLPEWNPYAPRTPCAPGLLFWPPNSTEEMGNKPESLVDGQPVPRTVFARVSKKPARWLYLGEYRFRPTLPLSEWYDMSFEHREQWKPESPKQTEERKREWRQQWLDLNNQTKMLSVYTMECIAYHEPIQKAIIRL